MYYDFFISLQLRNLCYLIIRRERVKKEVHKASQDIFYKQNDILESKESTLSEEDFNSIASGNELMRFTKFPSYSMYGPPFADHLGEDGPSEDTASSSGVCFSGGGTVGVHNEDSCSYTSYTGDGVVVRSGIEASSSNTISCGDGNESVEVGEVIAMKDTDQPPPGNAKNDNMQGSTNEKPLNLNGIKKNLIEDAKEKISKSNISSQNKAESFTETDSNTDSIQNPDSQAKYKDTINVLQKQTVDSSDEQSDFINSSYESPMIETKSAKEVDSSNCVASERSCRTPKRYRKSHHGQNSTVKRVLRSSPRHVKGNLEIELPMKNDIVSRLGNMDLRSPAGPAEDESVICQNVDIELKKRLGLGHADEEVSRRPPRRITRSCDRSIDSALCEADSSILQRKEHKKQTQPDEINENRDSESNVCFDKQESIAVDTQETTNVDCSGTPADGHSESSFLRKPLEQSEVTEKDSTDILNNSDLLSDKNLETNVDEFIQVTDLPNGTVDLGCKVDRDSNDDRDCSVDPDCKFDTDCNVDRKTDQIKHNDKDNEVHSRKIDCLKSPSGPENVTQAVCDKEKDSLSDSNFTENRSLENLEKFRNVDSSSEVCVQPDVKNTPSTETAALETDTLCSIKKCAQENAEVMKSPCLPSSALSEHDVKESTTIETGAPETDTSVGNCAETIGDHDGTIHEKEDLKPDSVSLSKEYELEPSSTLQAASSVVQSSLVDTPAVESPVVNTPATESLLVDTPAAQSSLVDTPQLCVEQQVLNDDETVTAESSFNENFTDGFQTITGINANDAVVNGHCSESSFSQKENDSPNNDTTTLSKHEPNGTEAKEGPGPVVPRRLSFDLERRDETYLNDRNFFDKFMDSSKNPVVLLNELSGIERMKEDRPTDLIGLNSSPRKTKKISDVPSPAFPHTVIDDLIACPQRLTRGRTQLMMMDEHRNALSRKGYKNRRKTHHFTNRTSDPDVPRLTRRRLRSFGLEKLDLINNELINEVGMTSSHSPRKRDIDSDNRSTPNGNTELEEVFLKDISETTSVLEEITGSPTRLTRARVRSLGLGYGKG